MSYLFTSESVSEGHPDKVSDQISDALIDNFMAFDPSSKLIFTSNGSGTVSVVKEVSANMFKLVETITSKRGARTISLDSKTHMVYLPTADYEPLPADSPKGTRAKMIPGLFQVLVLAPSKK